jgi:hypothetical protein
MTDLEKLNFFNGGIEGVQLLMAKLDCLLRTTGATHTGMLWPQPSTIHECNRVCTWQDGALLHLIGNSRICCSNSYLTEVASVALLLGEPVRNELFLYHDMSYVQQLIA